MKNGKTRCTSNLMMIACTSHNLFNAFKRISKKNTSAGCDNVTRDLFKNTFPQCVPQAKNLLLNNIYYAAPLRKVLINKNKKIRKLLIPTFHDRYIQQAILQTLQWHVEPFFSASSFGYRPGRNTQQALLQAIEYIKQGYKYILHLDFKNFFDEINHEILLARVKMLTHDDKINEFIRSTIKAPVIFQGEVSHNEKGIPQGAPISPLLANIYLDILDKELERLGHRFCRYADDCRIFIDNPFAAKDILNYVTNFVRDVLHLEINQNKTYTGLAVNQEFLGFIIQSNYEVGLSEQRIAAIQQLTKKMVKKYKLFNPKKHYPILSQRFHYYFSGLSKPNKDKLENTIKKMMKREKRKISAEKKNISAMQN